MGPQVRTYVTPRGIISGPLARRAIDEGRAWPFLGGAAYLAAEISTLNGNGHSSHLTLPAREGPRPIWLEDFRAERPRFCGLAMDRTRIMGIVNVTPDSFSDGGLTVTADTAIARGVALAEAGADIIDIGGESTRPGAMPVSPDEEVRRVLPVVTALANRSLTVSIDTRNASTMEIALAAGAAIVNDVTALSGPKSLEFVARSKASVVLMHMQGGPRTMQDNPTYAWAPGDILDVLRSRASVCEAAGISRSRIAIDPGIGFGQNDEHIKSVFDHLTLFHGLQCVVVVGASRKAFISRMGGGEGPKDRLAGSISAAVAAAAKCVQIVRVHDVRETRQALQVHMGLVRTI